jgi:hypothetical protein
MGKTVTAKIKRDKLGRFAKGYAGLRGENSFNWRGNSVGYNALHCWVRKELGKSNFCSFNKEHAGRYEWASKSHNAKRDVNDFIPLCASCHKKYDHDYKLSKRNEEVRKLATTNITFREIGRRFNLSGARVGQICR